MELELILSNDRRGLPSVRAFALETLRQLPLPQPDRDELVDLVFEAVRDAVDHAYPRGTEGSVRLTVREKDGRLEIRVRDFGLPQDVTLLERQFHEPSASLFGHRADLVDETHWLAFGPQGKALQLLKWLHVSHVAEQVAAESLAPFHEDAPLAPAQQYAVRAMRPEEAVQVSQLMYRAYGNTYFNADVYYPERVAALNAGGALASFVVVAEDGSVVGHCALELDQDGPVAESGQAVIDPAHRSRGLLNLLNDAVRHEATKRGLAGWYGDAVAVHTLTQKLNVTHGGRLTAVELGITPKSERFHGLAEELPQRVTCLLYFHWLKTPTSRTVYAPDHHRDILTTIYGGLGCPIQFGEPSAPTGHGTLKVTRYVSAARGMIRVEQLGADTVAAVRRAKRELIERSRAEVVFVELPLEDAGAADVAAALEADGFGFGGVAPHFSPRSDLLRLVYLVEPLAREPIKTYDEAAGRLVDYALAEQARVRGTLDTQ